MRSWLGVPLIALVLAACGTQAPGTSPSATGRSTGSPTSSAAVAAACPAATGLMPQGDAGGSPVPLAADVTASAAIECAVEDRPVAGDGVWSFVVEKRAEAGPELDRLVTALRAPDEPTPSNVACSLMLVLVTWFAVVDEHGRWLRPHVPTTSCGQPQQAVLTALEGLHWTTVSATKSTQTSTEAEAERVAAAAAAGCVTPFKDMLAIQAGDRAPKASPGPWPDLGGTVTAVCRYTAAPDKDGMPLLTFESGHKATAAQSAAVSTAWKQTGPVAGCSLQHTVVTVLFIANRGWHLVEDDGCHRVLDGDNGTWGQATPELLAALR